MSIQDVLAAIANVKNSTIAIGNAFDVPLSKLTAISAAAAESAAAAQRSAIAAAAGGSGGSTPAPAPSPTGFIARLKAASTLAPANYAAIPRTSAGTFVSQVVGDNMTPIRVPGGNGDFVRHWVSNPPSGVGGSKGFPDLATVTKMVTAGSYGPAEGGGVYFTSNSGDSRTQVIGAGGSYTGISGDISDICFGFKHTGRGFGFANRIDGYPMLLYVDDKLRDAPWRWTVRDTYSYVDFGTVGTRNIVVKCGNGMQVDEMAVAPSDVIVPYDFTSNKIVYAYMGDSWGQTGDSVSGMMLPQLIGTLVGASHVVGSVIGGTGYVATSNGTQPNAQDAVRRQAMKAGSPDVTDICMIINDTVATTANETEFTAAVTRVLANTRTDTAGRMMMVTAWCSMGSRATNTTGNEYKKRTIIKAATLALSGKWIFIDAFTGSWTTSDGTSRASLLGPMITGEGSAESPTGTGNADTWIDNNGGRHPTSVGIAGIANWKAMMYKEALTSMAS